MEARLEGVQAGVRQILARAREEVDGPFGAVRGLLADLIQVSVDSAAMVDVALGDRSQHLVVAGTRLLDYLQSSECRLPGRAGFLWLASSAPRGDAYRARIEAPLAACGTYWAALFCPILESADYFLDAYRIRMVE